jgi:hypothetical protein
MFGFVGGNYEVRVIDAKLQRTDKGSRTSPTFGGPLNPRSFGPTPIEPSSVTYSCGIPQPSSRSGDAAKAQDGLHHRDGLVLGGRLDHHVGTHPAHHRTGSCNPTPRTPPGARSDEHAETGNTNTAAAAATTVASPGQPSAGVMP